MDSFAQSRIGGLTVINMIKQNVLNKKGGIISIGLILVIWEIISHFTPPYLIPNLSTIFDSFLNVITTWKLIRHAFITVARILIALNVAFIVGALLSIFMGFFEKLEDYILPVLHFVMGVPALSWVVFSIIWFPEVEIRILFILVACCAPNYTLELHDAIKAIPKDLKEMMESFRPTRLQLFNKLILPSIVPAILTSWKINVGYATRVAMVAELVGATAGVGFQLLSAQELLDMPGAIAWTLVLFSFLLLSQFLLGSTERKLLSYRPGDK
jgi:ABC-type nitrate/sulfonate/bicarbonate transport system permease component